MTDASALVTRYLADNGVTVPYQKRRHTQALCTAFVQTTGQTVGALDSRKKAAAALVRAADFIADGRVSVLPVSLPFAVTVNGINVQSDDFLRSRVWRLLRYRVLRRYGATCQCCGRSKGVVICVDHIKPRHTHPELALVEDNLQVLCEDCNIGKGAWDNTDWRDNAVVPITTWPRKDSRRGEPPPTRSM